MRKAEDKEEAATVEADNKVKEKSLAVAGGRCWKKVLLGVLQKTGDLFKILAFHGRLNFLAVFSSETWVLPIITLLLIVAYIVVAIYFYYNMDD